VDVLSDQGERGRNGGAGTTKAFMISWRRAARQASSSCGANHGKDPSLEVKREVRMKVMFYRVRRSGHFWAWTGKEYVIMDILIQAADSPLLINARQQGTRSGKYEGYS